MFVYVSSQCIKGELRHKINLLSCGKRMDPIAVSMQHSTRFIDNENRKTKPTMGQNKTGKQTRD